MECARSCCWLKQRLSLRSIFLSVIGLWVKRWHRNKATCSESNPVQSSRSKSRTWPRKGRRFGLNSTATSDGEAQKLGNDVRRDSESIATKVCSQISSKWNAMFQNHAVTSVDRTSFDFRFEFFLQSAFVNIHLLCYWPTIFNLISKICPNFQAINSDFFEVNELLVSAWWALSKNCAKWKYFNSNLCRMR